MSCCRLNHRSALGSIQRWVLVRISVNTNVLEKLGFLAALFFLSLWFSPLLSTGYIYSPLVFSTFPASVFAVLKCFSPLLSICASDSLFVPLSFQACMTNSSAHSPHSLEPLSLALICSPLVHPSSVSSEQPRIIYCLMAYRGSHQPRGASLYLLISIPFVLVCVRDSDSMRAGQRHKTKIKISRLFYRFEVLVKWPVLSDW